MSKTERSFDEIVEAQRKYVLKRFGRKVAKDTDYGIGSDGEVSYVESIVHIACRKCAEHQYLLTTYVTDAEGKTSNIHHTGRKNSVKHVINL